MDISNVIEIIISSVISIILGILGLVIEYRKGEESAPHVTNNYFPVFISFQNTADYVEKNKKTIERWIWGFLLIGCGLYTFYLIFQKNGSISLQALSTSQNVIFLSLQRYQYFLISASSTLIFSKVVISVTRKNWGILIFNILLGISLVKTYHFTSTYLIPKHDIWIILLLTTFYFAIVFTAVHKALFPNVTTRDIEMKAKFILWDFSLIVAPFVFYFINYHFGIWQ